MNKLEILEDILLDIFGYDIEVIVKSNNKDQFSVLLRDWIDSMNSVTIGKSDMEVPLFSYTKPFLINIKVKNK